MDHFADGSDEFHLAAIVQKQALAKAEECAKAAALAKTDNDRAFHDRMRRKWLGIADGWRVIDEVGEAS
jgi:hypothetical protein